ncbi:U32 family peptidase [Rhodopirellula sp. JC740]|uniref:U32 family peptidase n=1 Tax=Rhodopirellula halodulae TaxID=2894198 RepID=A0ABS8NND1_9BACT|nr:U32 family peptidase [Rhodopirellula sp. JC740]MCC9645078.1 U32 family peptidase [Rhodopirellula sp. JC740]
MLPPNLSTPPELLAPAGNWDCADAAIENGADAIYFGLDRGFNARHRAANFGVKDLPSLMGKLHLRGLRGYVTLNTLVFPEELSGLIEVIDAIASAGVDAVLVQDFGVARIVKAICPDLEIHASTQMSLTSSETIAVAESLGLSRVVVARELSVSEIKKIRSKTQMPLEAFIHGALCVAYSGQCLTSESLGGRSANRGQCAQACRLPYELVCDGEDRDLGDVRYLLSPQDLAGYAAIPDMIDAGVNSLKIEGRLKTPEYVANICGHYRRAIDQAVAEGTVDLGDEARHEMELSFSRGFTPGWLEGNDHKRLVPGIRSAKQGIELGEVRAIGKDSILVDVQCRLALGDGLAIQSAVDPNSGRAFDSGFADHHQGGRIYSLNLDQQERSNRRQSSRKNQSNERNSKPKSPSPWERARQRTQVAPGSSTSESSPSGSFGAKRSEVEPGQSVWIGFGRGELDFSRIEVGAAVFKNDDPQLNKRLAATFGGKPRRTRALDLHVVAKVGSPIEVTGTLGSSDPSIRDPSIRETVVGEDPLDVARKHAITDDVLTDKLGRLGGSPFHLGTLTSEFEGNPMVPLGLLNQLRRELVERVEDQLHTPPRRTVRVSAGKALIAPIASDNADDPSSSADTEGATLSVLCRNMEQVHAAIAMRAKRVYVDFHDPREHKQAISLSEHNETEIWIASIRMQKPGEMGLLKQLIKQEPAGVLARNLAAMNAGLDAGLPTIADFSLNVANHRSAEWLIDQGVQRVTASYDLNADQLDQLVRSMPATWLELVLHQHMPMFHMEHCVFCSVLSPGTNKTNCGRPCDTHVVQLRDRVGKLHELQADIACRNTLFNATPQSGADITRDMMGHGVRSFRVELLTEKQADAEKVLQLYQQLLAGEIEGRDVWQNLAAENRVGVTRGTLEAKRNPLAIL